MTGERTGTRAGGRLARLRRLLTAPRRLYRRERRARGILAEDPDPAVLEAKIDARMRELRATARTEHYRRRVADDPKAGAYADRLDELSAEVRALVRARAILRARSVAAARECRASSHDRDRPGPVRTAIESLRRRLR